MKSTYCILNILLAFSLISWAVGRRFSNQPKTTQYIQSGFKQNKREEWKPLFKDDNFKYVIKDRWVPASKIFSFHDEQIDVLYNWPEQKEPSIGMVVTKKEYQLYNLEFEFKWGERHYKPRLDQKKDAGVVFHATTTKQAWSPRLEYQIQEGGYW